MDNGASSYRRFRDNGDETGLAEIIRNYRDGLILYLNSYVGNLHIAEELAEDTFVLLGTKCPRDNGKSSFKTWLYTIGRNIALNHLRRQKRHNAVSFEELSPIPDEINSPEFTSIRKEQNAILYNAISKLKPEYRQILWLVYFEGFSIKDAAMVMKKTVHSTETLVYRARKSLKSQLEVEGFVYEKL